VGAGDPTGTDVSDTHVAEAAEIAPDGTPLWSVSLAMPTPGAGYTGSQLLSTDGALDPTGHAFALTAWQWSVDVGSTTANIATVTRISASGTILWTTATSDLTGFMPIGDGAGIAVDAADDTFVGGMLTGSATIGGLGTATANGTADAAFLVLDGSGALRAAGHWAPASAGSSANALSIALDGAAVVVGGAAYDDGAATQEFFVAKLGW
jgi:hypothetical protein